MVISEGENRESSIEGRIVQGRRMVELEDRERERKRQGKWEEKGKRRGKVVGGTVGWRRIRLEIRVIRGVTSVNRDRAATGLQVYRADNADRSIGFSEMQRRG